VPEPRVNMAFGRWTTKEKTTGSRAPLAPSPRPAYGRKNGEREGTVSSRDQLTRFQVWPPQNRPPKAQP
jgi:hypothetical protein